MGKQNNEQLNEFIKEVKATEYAPLGWKVIRSDKLLAMDIPEQDFLVKPLIPKGGITILSGNPGRGKSWTLLEIARCVASDMPLFMGKNPDYYAYSRFDTKSTNVLYIDEESSLSEIKRRWTMLNTKHNAIVDFMSYQDFKIDDKEKRAALLDLIDARNYGLVIFDSLIDLHTKNENDTQQIQEVFGYFREITKRGVTVLIAHHQRKEGFRVPRDAAQMLRGSSAILANVDCLLTIEGFKSVGNKITLTINQAKLRQGKRFPKFKISLTQEDKAMVIGYVGATSGGSGKTDEAEQKIIEFLKSGKKSNKEILKHLLPLNFSKNTIIRGLNKLQEGKTIEKTKQGRSSTYSLIV